MSPLVAPGWPAGAILARLNFCRPLNKAWFNTRLPYASRLHVRANAAVADNQMGLSLMSFPTSAPQFHSPIRYAIPCICLFAMCSLDGPVATCLLPVVLWPGPGCGDVLPQRLLRLTAKHLRYFVPGAAERWNPLHLRVIPA
jgi:hypothetical protein